MAYEVIVTRAFGMAPEVTEFATYAEARKYSDTFGRGRSQSVFRCSIVDKATRRVVAS